MGDFGGILREFRVVFGEVLRKFWRILRGFWWNFKEGFWLDFKGILVEF